MTKIAILNCLQANEVCAACSCLKAYNEKIRHFQQYAEQETQLVALGRCNGCQAGLDKGFLEKLDRMVSEGAQVCHVGVCTVRRETGKECPTITKAAQYLEAKGVKVVRGTH